MDVQPKSLVRSLSTTGRWLRKHFWVWPLLAAIILGWAGWGVRGTVEQAMKRKMADAQSSTADTTTQSAKVHAVAPEILGQETGGIGVALVLCHS